MSFPVLAPSVREGSLPGWVGPVAAAVVVQLALLTGYVARFGFDVSALVCVREAAVGQPPYEHVRTSLSRDGFDGQFYYAIARDPWHRQDERVVATPGGHQLRVLYPALGWLASGGGEPRRLLWALPAVNLAAFAGLALFGALVAGKFGRSPWWGFFLPLLVNAGTPALRDLTDPVSTLAVFGLVATYLLRGNALALLLWALAAVFSREQNAAVVALLAGLAVVERRRLAAVAGVAALAALAAWAWRLKQMYGAWPFETGTFDWPFAGMWYRWQHVHGDAAARSAPIHLAGLVFIAAQAVLSLLLPLYRAPRAVALVAIAGAALAVLGSGSVWMDGHSYTRVFVWMPLGVWLWAVYSGRTWPAVLLAPALLWPAYAVFQVWRR